MKSRKPEIESKPKYQPKAQEMEAFKSHFVKREKQAWPRMKVDDGVDQTVLSYDHPDSAIGQVLVMEAIGTADYDFFSGLLQQLSNGSARGGKVDERLLNFMLSVIKGIKPRDQIEIMLAAQMAAIHEAIMTFTKRLAHVETIPQQDSAERALNKLARTFATQMEALQRYRTGGKQKVMVQQVSVNEGGQAIVGNVMQAQRQSEQESPKEPPLVAHEPRSGMAVMIEMANVPRYPSSRSRHKRHVEMGDHPRNTGPMLASLRCGAHTRPGQPCKTPAVCGATRCRMHGGGAGSGAVPGNKNALKHGLRTGHAIEERRQVQELMRRSRRLISGME
jgi:hypothetical protein